MSRELAVPPAIRDHLVDLVRLRWSGRDGPPPVDALPATMPEGEVCRLSSGGPFGWLIDARLDQIDGRVALEALEDDRMSGPDHYRVWDDGTREALPNERIAYATPPNCSPEERARIQEEYYAHNRAVGELLRERGFR